MLHPIADVAAPGLIIGLLGISILVIVLVVTLLALAIFFIVRKIRKTPKDNPSSTDPDR